MPTFNRKSAGANVTVAAIKRRSAGAWVNVGAVYRRAAGAWVQVWPLITAAITNKAVVATGTTIQPQAFYELNPDGKVYTGNSAAGTRALYETWMTNGVNTNFQVRATLVSGPNPGNVGTWLALSATRTWATVDTVQGDGTSAVTQLTIEIRNASTLAVLTTATITLTASWNAGGAG